MHVRFKQFMVIFEIELSKTINYTLEREREGREICYGSCIIAYSEILDSVNLLKMKLTDIVPK